MNQRNFTIIACRLVGIYFVISSCTSFAMAVGQMLFPFFQSFLATPGRGAQEIYWRILITYCTGPIVELILAIYLIARAGRVASLIMPPVPPEDGRAFEVVTREE